MTTINISDQTIRPIISDGITRYIHTVRADHNDYHACGLDKLYKVEKDHFWFIYRRNLIKYYFQKFVEIHQEIIEIGAGTGCISRMLMESGFKPAVGELHLSGLYYAKTYGIKDLYQFDLFKPPFLNKFDAVGMFDVLEHLEDDVLALNNVSKMLKSNGRVILTVPAHHWLWNRSDKIAGHKRRYSKKKLISVVESSGFNILEVKYFFIFIVPLFWLRTIINRDDNSSVNNEEYNKDIKISPIINKLLLSLCHLEEKINKYLPNITGGSLILIAEKK